MILLHRYHKPILDKWAMHWISIAKQTAEMSKDPSTKVGCVIARDKQMISAGYNGFPACINDHPERLDMRELKYKLVVHAEANAIMTALKTYPGIDLSDCTLFCTLMPCNECMKLILTAGIKSIFVDDTLHQDKQKDSQYRNQDWPIALETAIDDNPGIYFLGKLSEYQLSTDEGCYAKLPNFI